MFSGLRLHAWNPNAANSFLPSKVSPLSSRNDWATGQRNGRRMENCGRGGLSCQSRVKHQSESVCLIQISIVAFEQLTQPQMSCFSSLFNSIWSIFNLDCSLTQQTQTSASCVPLAAHQYFSWHSQDQTQWLLAWMLGERNESIFSKTSLWLLPTSSTRKPQAHRAPMTLRGPSVTLPVIYPLSDLPSYHNQDVFLTMGWHMTPSSLEMLTDSPLTVE